MRGADDVVRMEVLIKDKSGRHKLGSLLASDLVGGGLPNPSVRR
jgi:hypothetical protein